MHLQYKYPSFELIISYLLVYCKQFGYSIWIFGCWSYEYLYSVQVPYSVFVRNRYGTMYLYRSTIVSSTVITGILLPILLQKVGNSGHHHSRYKYIVVVQCTCNVLVSPIMKLVPPLYGTSTCIVIVQESAAYLYRYEYCTRTGTGRVLNTCTVQVPIIVLYGTQYWYR